jgi:hypothetical protein
MNWDLRISFGERRHPKNFNLLRGETEIMLAIPRRRGSQVVRQGSAKASFVGSIPTLASKPNQLEL